MKKEQVHIILCDNKRRILLQQRDDNNFEGKFIINAGTWGFFGGSIEDDESKLAGLRRELYEEINLRLSSLPKFFMKVPLSGSKKIYNYVYYAKFMQSKHDLCLHEGQGMGWFTSHEIKHLKIAKEDAIVFEKINKDNPC